MPRRCKALNQAGLPCGGFAITDSDYCRVHTLIEKKKEIPPDYSGGCPPIREFIDSPLYLNLEEQTCDAVKDALVELFDPEQGYTEAALSWGVGAGKSFLCSLALTYLVYRTLCLDNPQAHYGLAPGSVIAFSNFSVNAAQAKRVLFSEVRARIDNAPCFDRPGFRRDQAIKSELQWPDKSVVIFPGHSQETSAVGYNLLAATLDEASHLPDVEFSKRIAGRATSGRVDAAEEIYSSVASRMLSRGNANFRCDALFLMISSPRYIGDFIQHKLASALTNPRIFISTLPTWEGAPAATYGGETFLDPTCGEVPIELKSYFDRNPELARRDYGAVPSESIGRYMELAAIEACIDHNRPIEGDCSEWLRVRRGTDYFIHVDLGLTRDACGVGMAHKERRGSGKESKEVVVVDWVGRYRPRDFAGSQIDFEFIRGVILDLRKQGFRIRKASCDGWQSVEFLQQLNRAGVPAETLSVDRTLEPYDTLLELVNAGLVELPSYDVLVQELSQLELVKSKKVDHPPHGSKDVSDAIAGAVFHAAQAPVARRGGSENLYIGGPLSSAPTGHSLRRGGRSGEDEQRVGYRSDGSWGPMSHRQARRLREQGRSMSGTGL